MEENIKLIQTQVASQFLILTQTMNKNTHTEFAKLSEIRKHFARAVSQMYREDVPAYGTLIQLVESVSQNFLQ